MKSTVAGDGIARPNSVQTVAVRKAGRPIDPLILGFDAALEALIVEKDDAAVLERGMRMARDIQQRIHALFEHLSVRAQRLHKIIPDQQEIVSIIDARLSARTAMR